MSEATGCSTAAKQQKLEGMLRRGARPRWAPRPVIMLCGGYSFREGRRCINLHLHRPKLPLILFNDTNLMSEQFDRV